MKIKRAQTVMLVLCTLMCCGIVTASDNNNKADLLSRRPKREAPKRPAPPVSVKPTAQQGPLTDDQREIARLNKKVENLQSLINLQKKQSKRRIECFEEELIKETKRYNLSQYALKEQTLLATQRARELAAIKKAVPDFAERVAKYDKGEVEKARSAERKRARKEPRSDTLKEESPFKRLVMALSPKKEPDFSE